MKQSFTIHFPYIYIYVCQLLYIILNILSPVQNTFIKTEIIYFILHYIKKGKGSPMHSWG